VSPPPSSSRPEVGTTRPEPARATAGAEALQSLTALDPQRTPSPSVHLARPERRRLVLPFSSKRQRLVPRPSPSRLPRRPLLVDLAHPGRHRRRLARRRADRPPEPQELPLLGLAQHPPRLGPALVHLALCSLGLDGRLHHLVHRHRPARVPPRRCHRAVLASSRPDGRRPCVLLPLVPPPLPVLAY